MQVTFWICVPKVKESKNTVVVLEEKRLSWAVTFLFFQERIARYVSMIPFLSDSAAFPDLCDIWATSEVRKSSSYKGIIV